MGAVAIVFGLLTGLIWGRVVLALGMAWGTGTAVAVIGALVALALGLSAGRGYVARGKGIAAQASRGFTALGLSFGLGALPLALSAIWRGEMAGASAAASGANPFGAIFGVPLAPILVGNLMAGVMLGLAAVAAALFLVLAAIFAAFAERQR